MNARTVITHAPNQGTPLSEAQLRTLVRDRLTIMSADDRILIDRFLTMIDRGTGGAQGMHAATRLEAKAAFAHVVAVAPDRALELAHTVSLGVRSQGQAVTALVGARRGV